MTSGNNADMFNQSNRAMTTKSLTEFAKEHGQEKAATLLGMTQGALSKALLRKRNIVVTALENGAFRAEERRPFPSKTAASAAV